MTLEDPAVASKLPLANGVLATMNATLLTILLFVFAEALAGWIVLSISVVYLGATLSYLVIGRANLYVHMMVWSSLVQNVAVHVVLGGYVWSGGFLTWGILVSTSVALLLGRRVATALTSIYLVAAVLLIVLEAPLRAGRAQPDPTLSALLAFDVIFVSLMIVVPVVILLLGQLASERRRSETLLRNVLPDTIAQRLKRSPGLIADGHESCTVLFADLVGFTDHARRISPQELVEELNAVFSRFDNLVSAAGAAKIKTMGDGYLAVAGAPDRRDDHAEVMCDIALGMQTAISELNRDADTNLSLRIGMATGGLVAGVVGTSRFSYDLWGDTVNLASRMEALAEPGSIRVTVDVSTASGDTFVFEDGGTCQVRGIGAVETAVLTTRKVPV